MALVQKYIERRGRAALSNESGRFERHAYIAEHDGWDIDEEPSVLRTEVREEVPRSVITYNRSPDLPFDRSINPYRGCEHGCIYCFARPTHTYLGFSPGLDFETQLIARPDAPRVLEQELRKKGYAPRTIAIGTNTDPYQPIERSYKIMRSCLEVLEAFQHPVAIVTKGAMITRDLDILERMAAKNLVSIGISVTTLEPAIARKLEPRVPRPEHRLATIETLAKAGIPVRVMCAPVIPGVTDHEIERILEKAKQAGATSASWIMLRLPREVSPLFQDWLAEHFPDRVNKVMGHIRAMHNGQDYLPDWGRRMRGEGPYAEMIKKRFRAAAKRLGLSEKSIPLRNDLFCRPPKVGDQLDLFA